MEPGEIGAAVSLQWGSLMNSDGGRAQEGLRSETCRVVEISPGYCDPAGVCWAWLDLPATVIMVLATLSKKGPLDEATILSVKGLLCEPPILKVGTLGCG